MSLCLLVLTKEGPYHKARARRVESGSSIIGGFIRPIISVIQGGNKARGGDSMVLVQIQGDNKIIVFNGHFTVSLLITVLFKKELYESVVLMSYQYFLCLWWDSHYWSVLRKMEIIWEYNNTLILGPGGI